MNKAPISLRFFSGSVTPLSCASIFAEASTQCTGRCSSSVNIFITRSCSLYRSSPLSTNTQCRRSPKALCTSTAATVESTPPERAQMACSVGPTCCLMAASCSSSTFSMRHVGCSWEIWKKKRSSVSAPRSECLTSGWYCRPKTLSAEFSMATTAPCSLRATQWKPLGSSTASSPWLIHTVCDPSVLPTSPNRAELCVWMGILPYSPPSWSKPLCTLPPSWCTMSCMP
mmetsp:Transcript_988/g.2570  ORF Transcript_988/g.2570 Transcript_988/m.2570 type:complete len:228 (-) Transcript_988:267-950(-)